MTAVSSGWSGFSLMSAWMSRCSRLTGTSRPTATTRGVSERSAPGRELGLDAGRGDRHPVVRDAQLVDDLSFGRGRKGHDAGPSVDGRGQTVLDGVPALGQTGGKDHLPHLGMDVMEEDDVRGVGPQGREERHPVPDLNQAVARSDPPQRAPSSAVLGNTAYRPARRTTRYPSRRTILAARPAPMTWSSTHRCPRSTMRSSPGGHGARNLRPRDRRSRARPPRRSA